MTFDEKLHRLCHLHGLSQAKLTEKLGGVVSDSTVGNWFYGKTLPTLPVALKLARILGVPLEYLADDSMVHVPKNPDELHGPARSAVDLIRALGLSKDEVIRRLSATPADHASAKNLEYELGSIRRMIAKLYESLRGSSHQHQNEMGTHQGGKMNQLEFQDPRLELQEFLNAQSISSRIPGAQTDPYRVIHRQLGDGRWIAYLIDSKGEPASRLASGASSMEAIQTLIRAEPELFPTIPKELGDVELRNWLERLHGSSLAHLQNRVKRSGLPAGE